jgi:hypothetical protein
MLRRSERMLRRQTFQRNAFDEEPREEEAQAVPIQTGVNRVSAVPLRSIRAGTRNTT